MSRWKTKSPCQHRWMLDVLLPEKCVLCQRQPRALCRDCMTLIGTKSLCWQRVGRVMLCTPGIDEQAALQILRAFKDDCRTGLASQLAVFLTPALESAITNFGRPDVFVTPPSSWQSWRKRGFAPVPVVLRKMGIRATPLLTRSRLATRSLDQRGLGVVDRARNVSGAFEVRKDVSGARVIIVDDVVTTGATLAEAVRALECAGASVVCAVALVRVAPRRKK